MKNREVANVFKEIVQMLEVKGENPFRIRAYEKAAQHIESMPEDIAIYVKEGTLKSISGIGKDLEEKIKEIVVHGRLEYLEELKKSIPQGVIDMLKVPGIGPKTAKMLYEKLEIRDLVMLERIAHAGGFAIFQG